jgi:hypothetical protein
MSLVVVTDRACIANACLEQARLHKQVCMSQAGITTVGTTRAAYVRVEPPKAANIILGRTPIVDGSLEVLFLSDQNINKILGYCQSGPQRTLTRNPPSLS